jgi:bifunctional non-homologous end joining protein LigD
VTRTFPSISPIIPVRRSAIFAHADWVCELKYDGFRALAYVGDGQCRLISRRGNQLKRFDELCRSIPTEVRARDAVIDGEIVALNQSGMPAFYDLLKRRNRIVYFGFDLLWLNGEDLRERSLLDRKKLLRSIIPREPFCVGYVGYTDREPERLFEIVKANDLEGVVVKRKDGKYRPQTKWFKVLNPNYSQRIGRADLFQWRQLRGS